MMKEVSDVKETAEEINGLKNKVSEVRSINIFFTGWEVCIGQYSFKTLGTVSPNTNLPVGEYHVFILSLIQISNKRYMLTVWFITRNQNHIVSLLRKKI